MRGRFRTRTAKLLYDLTIMLELALEQALDLVHPVGGKHHQAAVGDLTAIVKTFERPLVLRRLLKSIERRYPHLRVIVVDDSRDPKILPESHTIVLPYDSGVSAGRSEALGHVTTKYVLVLDDDFVFYRHTSLETSLEIMEHHPGIDIMGGEVVDLPFFETADYSREGLFPTDAEATMPAGSSIGGLPVYDKVANFFIARTDRIRLVGWDARLKRVDHADFFTRAKGILTTVFNKDMRCLHARTPFDRAYMEKREDIDDDLLVLGDRYSLAGARDLVQGDLPGSGQ
ncbi:MAG: glycosyltransferase [Desulfomonile tiedjei]|nr:glycosyltransferase [Desulfomonile tiedjei]